MGQGIFTRIEGEEGSWFVLIHGGFADHRIWLPVASHLTAAGHRVLLPDLPGYGKSEPVPDWSIPLAADSVLEAMRHRNVNDAVIAGFSVGGMVALQLALEQSDMVWGLGLISTGPKPADPGAFHARADNVEESGLGSDIARHLSLAFSADWVARNRSTYSRYAADAARCDPKTVASMFRGIADFDVTDRVGSLGAPVMVVVGEHDNAFRPVATDMARGIPRCTLVTLEGAGHTLPLEAPGPLGAALLELRRERVNRPIEKEGGGGSQ